MDEEALKSVLLKENKDFRAFHKEHQACEKKLAVFRKKGSLTAEEAVEERELKKRKLVLKDKMYHLMVEHSRTHP